MGMLVEGLNKVRDFWIEIVTATEAGSGDTQETAEDTDLQTPISNTERDILSSTTADQFVVFESDVPGTSGTGGELNEIIWKNKVADLPVSRITFPTITYNTDRSYKFKTRYYFKGRR